MASVSVPCRGAMFLNEGIKMKTTEYKFPSPVGELCFSMFYPESGMVRCWWFPSPVGELCFSIVNSNNFIIQRRLSFPSPVGELCFSMKCITMDTITIHCFRPLSGSYVSQLFIHFHKSSGSINVSVPCRGAMFLN